MHSVRVTFRSQFTISQQDSKNYPELSQQLTAEKNLPFGDERNTVTKLLDSDSYPKSLLRSELTIKRGPIPEKVVFDRLFSVEGTMHGEQRLPDESALIEVNFETRNAHRMDEIIGDKVGETHWERQ